MTRKQEIKTVEERIRESKEKAAADLERLSKQLADDGKLIEAGWIGLRLACGLQNAPADRLRAAFFTGAQHLFSSIMTILEPGAELTDKDIERLDLISSELVAFIEDFEKPAHEPPPKRTLGDAPIEREYREEMNSMAQYIDRFFNGPGAGGARKTGFVLLTFAFGDKGRCNYISNANRDDVVALLKEQLARLQGQPEVKGTA